MGSVVRAFIPSVIKFFETRCNPGGGVIAKAASLIIVRPLVEAVASTKVVSDIESSVSDLVSGVILSGIKLASDFLGRLAVEGKGVDRFAVTNSTALTHYITEEVSWGIGLPHSVLGVASDSFGMSTEISDWN